MSMGHWTGLRNGGQMILSTDTFVEGAKALKVNCLGSDWGILVLDQSISPAPKKVNIEFWFKYPTSCAACVFFRVVDQNNYYEVTITYATSTITRVYLDHRIAGARTQQDINTFNGNANTWYKYKIMFCQFGDTIYAEIYRWDNEAWVLKVTLTDATPVLTDGGAVGIGFDDRHASPTIGYFDDMKIYYV